MSIAFGGVFRDVLLHRDIALGGRNQSYGLAAGAGAATYVAMRQLHVHVYDGLPIGARIAAGIGASLVARAYAWNHLAVGEDIVWTMEKNADEHYAALRAAFAAITGDGP